MIFLNNDLLYLHKLIKKKSTGNRETLATKLGCCVRTVSQKIEELRTAGLPIKYCKQRQTYYYTNMKYKLAQLRSTH